VLSGLQVDVVAAQRLQLAGAQPMSVGQQDGRSAFRPKAPPDPTRARLY